MNHPKISRRGFLKKSSLAAAALGFPYVIPSRALGNGAVPPPSERVTLGHIGVGGQGSGLLGGFLGLEDCQSVAVCDAYGSRREASAARINQAYAERSGKSGYKGCAQYEDFRELLARKDIDAVVIATPDHWHVPIALAAARAGKDTYVEKPLGISIEENKALREAIHRYGRIFQYGTQQRCFNTHCAFACELVRNGRIGQLREIVVDAPGGSAGGSTQPIPPPEDLNYEMWLGPAPFSPYTADRCGGERNRHVPVVRRGNHHGVNILAGQQFPEILVLGAAFVVAFGGAFRVGFVDRRGACLPAAPVGIAHRHALAILEGQKAPQQSPALASHADMPQSYTLAGRRDPAGAQCPRGDDIRETQRRGCKRCPLEEIPSIESSSIHVSILQTSGFLVG